MATTAMERRTEIRTSAIHAVLNVLKARGCRWVTVGKHMLVIHEVDGTVYQAIGDSVTALNALNVDVSQGQHPQERWVSVQAQATRVVDTPRPEPLPEFDPDIWEKRADGYMYAIGRRTWGDLARHLKPELEKLQFGGESFEAVTEYLSFEKPRWLGGTDSTWETPLPKWKRIAVWPCTGGSEGWYVHLDAVVENDALKEGTEHRLLVLFKTFSGWEVAVEVAAAIARLMGA